MLTINGAHTSLGSASAGDSFCSQRETPSVHKPSRTVSQAQPEEPCSTRAGYIPLQTNPKHGAVSVVASECPTPLGVVNKAWACDGFTQFTSYYPNAAVPPQERADGAAGRGAKPASASVTPVLLGCPHCKQPPESRF